MKELDPSVLMPPVQLSTVPMVVFSIEQHRHPEVEAEIDYRFLAWCQAHQPVYLECYIPRDGHFPFLIGRILRDFPPPQTEQENFTQTLNDEFARLRKDGALGDVVILDESVYAVI